MNEVMDRSGKLNGVSESDGINRLEIENERASGVSPRAVTC